MNCLLERSCRNKTFHQVLDHFLWFESIIRHLEVNLLQYDVLGQLGSHTFFCFWVWLASIFMKWKPINYIPILPSPKAAGAVAETTSMHHRSCTSCKRWFKAVKGQQWMKMKLSIQCTHRVINKSSICHHVGHSPLGSIVKWIRFVLPVIFKAN